MNVNTIKKNMCALFVAMTVAATSYAADAPELSDKSTDDAYSGLHSAPSSGNLYDAI
jgi:hypothetical protein